MKYFFTGFPGFICNQLIRKIVENNELQGSVYALVLPSMMEKASIERKNIIRELNLKEEQFHLVIGDITKEGLSISNEQQQELIHNVTHVFHLAAIYDLAVPKDIAYLVNVDGTRNMNDWVMELRNLKRYVYFSTAYVAGFREGVLYEHELQKPSAFKNYYEETKYEAEVLVNELKAHIPVSIIRPGIVKGHSETGETIKFDGPYFILNVLDKLRLSPFIPRIGSVEAVINLVPIDYILNATVYLSFSENGIGKTYHLTDPNPYRVSEVYEMMVEYLLKKKLIGSLPIWIVKCALSLKMVRTYLQVEKETIDYFTWMGNFDCSQTIEDLKDSGIVCPDFKEGIPSMINFYEKHKSNPHYQVSIT
ncbi:SDR family oxidoreductase [Cytobacillus spongiae]|uniref:SDR family oxidoreductase n=1 Tax=Cytobacillus spongiae TaxID=2901381 RepID=UPI001F1B9F22|nr:SDR family oxidoreductase [Cytobacillus spongiae]UII57143.1 SDR family oxidoreductase [Cytobacillus spongiae]